jgi:putative serine protease PepD
MADLDDTSTPVGPPGPMYGQPPSMPPPTGPAMRQAQPPSRRKGGGGTGWWKIAVTAIIAGLVGALLILLVMPAIFGVNPYDLIRGKVATTEKHEEVSLPRKVTNVVSPTQGALDVSSIAQKVTPSIVNIDVTANTQTSPFQTAPTQGTGSGIIYTANGYIITNNHVVVGATHIAVTFANGAEMTAKTVGTDPQNDIAVVKVDATGLPAASLGDSDNLAVGELVVAVGSPLGFQQTVTAGIISALHRNVAGQDQNGTSFLLTDLIQTDAAINPGNSGGGLCDSAAKIIGVNALIASQTGGSVGIGFAIPINTAKAVADAIMAGKPVSHPYIGVQGQTVSPDIAQQYKLPVSEGAYVAALVPGSPAEKTGLKVGDIIVSANGQPVKSADDLIAAVRKTPVGSNITLEYYRGNNKQTVAVPVVEEPKNISGA